MNRETRSCFDSIDSAHEFLDLLSETVTEVRQEIDAEMKEASDSQSPRRLQALQTVSYKLDNLAVYMKKSCRILNDLRTLRRLLSGGTGCCAAAVSKAAEMATSEGACDLAGCDGALHSRL
jgi:hypothetical protein